VRDFNMGEEVKRTIKFTLVFMVLLGLVYPFVMTGIANLLFPYQAKGSIIKVDGKPVGSELIGQKFTDPHWFMGRPSAVDYDVTSSGDLLRKMPLLRLWCRTVCKKKDRRNNKRLNCEKDNGRGPNL